MHAKVEPEVKRVSTYCYQCVNGPDLLTVETVDGVATKIEPNFDLKGEHPADEIHVLVPGGLSGAVDDLRSGGDHDLGKTVLCGRPEVIGLDMLICHVSPCLVVELQRCCKKMLPLGCYLLYSYIVYM